MISVSFTENNSSELNFKILLTYFIDMNSVFQCVSNLIQIFLFDTFCDSQFIKVEISEEISIEKKV